MLIKEIKPDFVFSDDRGTLTQILHDDINQVNAVFTKKNAVRGNWHYHKYCKEYFYIIEGSVTVKARLDDCEEEQSFGSGAMFFIPEKSQDSVRNALKDYIYFPFEFESGGSQIIYKN